MPIAEFLAVNLDCDNPPELAEFYSKLTGGEVTYSSDEYAGVQLPGAITMYFQKVADHRPPTWPDSERPQQSHLDFYVDDLPEAEAAALGFGASKPDFQPGADKCLVLLDRPGTRCAYAREADRASLTDLGAPCAFGEGPYPAGDRLEGLSSHCSAGSQPGRAYGAQRRAER